MKRLTALYREKYGEIETIGLGDGHNDAGFLGAVDMPVIVRSPFATVLKKLVPKGMVTNAPGPHGWNEAILQLLKGAAALAV